MIHPATVGSALSELDTPVLLVNLRAMERNIRRMADLAGRTGHYVRPHVKAHKTPIVARKQLDAGANGVTCSKLGEAEAMVDGGIDHILVSTELVGRPKLRRLTSLARHAHVIVVVDAADPATALSTHAQEAHVELGVLVDVNVGQNRTGVEPGNPAVDLARYVAGLPNLRFEGLQGYEGNLQHIVNETEREQRCREAMTKLVATRNAIERSGLPVRIVSTGGTGTAAIAATYDQVTEIQPGSYIFMDSDYGRVEGLPYESALTVLTTVISRPRPGVAIVDAGLKAVSTDAGIPRTKALPGVEYKPHGDEHGRLEALTDEPLPDLGQVVELIPSHCDTTVNLYESFTVIEEDQVQAVWPIAARGCVA